MRPLTIAIGAMSMNAALPAPGTIRVMPMATPATRIKPIGISNYCANRAIVRKAQLSRSAANRADPRLMSYHDAELAGFLQSRLGVIPRVLQGGCVKIQLGCRENQKFAIDVEVYALTFDPAHRTFTMPLCIGDDWHQTIRCPMQVEPTRMHFQWQTAFIQFERELDARAFGA
jgi:hypothetical protein